MALRAYVDKNVVFQYAHDKLFGENVAQSSTVLVQSIISGTIEAYVSPDVVFAFYNHIHFKLRRSLERGGKGLDWDDAAQQAREFTEVTFGKGAWHVVSLTIEELRAALRDHRFDFEDAVQFHSAKQAGAVLVTWNIRHFERMGMPVKTPKEFLREQPL